MIKIDAHIATSQATESSKWPTDAEEKIKHVENIPRMQLFTGISRDTQSKSYMLSSTSVPGNFEWCIVGYSSTWMILWNMNALH